MTYVIFFIFGLLIGGVLGLFIAALVSGNSGNRELDDEEQIKYINNLKDRNEY